MGADSTGTAAALAELYPALHFIVQMSEPPSHHGAVEAGKTKEFNPRIAVQKRAPGALQTENGAVFILRLPVLLPGVPSNTLPARILAELRSHLGVLRTNPKAVSLVLAPRLLPEPGSVDSDVEATARLHDLSRLQLANESEMEMGELVEMVCSVHDSMGCLVVVNKLRSRNTATMALGVKYQAYVDRHHEAEPRAI